MNRDDITRCCYEATRAICMASGDDSRKPWDEVEPWMRDSTLKGVDFAVGCPDATPAAQHDAWMGDRLADGWTYGPVKDNEAKIHPALMPYDQLPFDQRVKDHVFRAIVSALKGHVSGWRLPQTPAWKP